MLEGRRADVSGSGNGRAAVAGVDHRRDVAVLAGYAKTERLTRNEVAAVRVDRGVDERELEAERMMLWLIAYTKGGRYLRRSVVRSRDCIARVSELDGDGASTVGGQLGGSWSSTYMRHGI